MIRSTDECEMSRSCQSATSSSAAWALPRSSRARPATCSDLIGLRLCGIELEPFWPRAERLAHLADLGAREVADLGREPLETGAGERDRLQQLGVAVARRPPGSRPARARSPSRASTRSSNSGEVAEYVPTAPDNAPTAAWANARSSRSALRSRLEREAGQLDPERRRLGVDAVRAPGAQRVRRARGPAAASASTSGRESGRIELADRA